ncbi:MAG: alpha-galactosidase [Armatimonadetes bacterium]|nr:alpha-galactosidase [Armatimonadota bacterium]
MKSLAGLARLVFVCGAMLAAVSTGSLCAGLTDFSFREKPCPEVRFMSGKTIYDELLVGDKWVGRYWATDGYIRSQSGHFGHPQSQNVGGTEEAFELEIDGMLLSSGWKWVSAAEATKTDRGSRHFIVELRNTLRPVKVKMHTLLDGTPVIVRWLEITNSGDKPAAMDTVSPWSGQMWVVPGYQELLPKGVNNVFTLGYFTSSYWGWEGWFDWMPLRSVTTRIDGFRGAGADAPFFIVRNEAVGQYFFGHLAWSANYHMEFRCEQDPGVADQVTAVHHKAEPRLSFKIGPSASAPQRIISPGETIETPKVHLGHMEGDLDSVVQAMHEHLRRSVVPPDPPGRSLLVEYDNVGYSAYYLRDHPDNIFKDIDLAADLGAEVYIMDSWWWDVTGDWVPSPGKLPKGLEVVSDYVHKKGMLFGLYMEAERAAGDSKVGKAHPEWLLSSAILDLTKPEAAAWMESEACRLIDEYKVDLFRLDFNPFYTNDHVRTPRDGFLENNYWRYYRALYDTFDRIRAKYPKVIFQQCSQGGARNDLGMAGRFQETYLTDGLHTPRVFRDLCGQMMAFPPEALVVAFGCPTPYDYRGHLDTHLRATFTLSRPFFMQVGPSQEELGAERRERFVHYINLYKKFIRPVLPKSKVYCHAPVSATTGIASGGWFAVEYASPDRKKGWATIIRLGESDSDTYVLKPKGLNPGKKYKVTFDGQGTQAVVDGLTLMQSGLPVHLQAIMSSELLLFEAE